MAMRDLAAGAPARLLRLGKSRAAIASVLRTDLATAGRVATSHRHVARWRGDVGGSGLGVRRGRGVGCGWSDESQSHIATWPPVHTALLLCQVALPRPGC